MIIVEYHHVHISDHDDDDDQEEHRQITGATQPPPQASTTPCLADRSHHDIGYDHDDGSNDDDDEQNENVLCFRTCTVQLQCTATSRRQVLGKNIFFTIFFLLILTTVITNWKTILI